jgi:ribose 5-phosphate isomerase B
MSIVANKIPGVRAALCFNEEMASLARLHNDANILCLGARIIDTETAEKSTITFLSTPFEDGRHSKRVKKIHDLTGC